MALTADSLLELMYPNIGYIMGIPTTVADVYYKGALVNTNVDGDLVVAADTVNHHFAGIVAEQVTVLSGETKTVKVIRGTVAHIPHSGAAKADIGTLVYATADDALAHSATNIGPAGKVVGYESGILIVDFGDKVDVDKVV